MELKGCAAIVTGGGLGQRICRALALNGVDILVNDAAFNKTIAYPDLDSMTGQTVVMDCGRL